MKKIFAIVMVLAMVAAIVVPLAVSAAPGYTTTISGNVSAALELVAPGTAGAYSLGALGIGANSPAAATPGSVSCNDPAGFNVWVKSDKADGKMQVTVAGPITYTLGAALVVTTGDGTFTPGLVDTTGAKCVSSSAPAIKSIPLSATQQIAYTDPAVNGYSIVLTYTATPGAP